MAIQDPDKARRLARSICNDIKLYNADAIEQRNADAIGGPIWEGHELYTSRVSPALAGLYEETVREMFRLELMQLPRRSGGGSQQMGHPPTGREQQGAPSMILVLAALA